MGHRPNTHRCSRFWRGVEGEKGPCRALPTGGHDEDALPKPCSAPALAQGSPRPQCSKGLKDMATTSCHGLLGPHVARPHFCQFLDKKMAACSSGLLGKSAGKVLHFTLEALPWPPQRSFIRYSLHIHGAQLEPSSGFNPCRRAGAGQRITSALQVYAGGPVAFSAAV